MENELKCADCIWYRKAPFARARSGNCNEPELNLKHKGHETLDSVANNTPACCKIKTSRHTK